MQNIKKGLIVRSISGHDRSEQYIVINFDDKFAYLVNGKSRPISNPKKKSLKHIIKTGENEDILKLIETNKIENSVIIKVLKDFIQGDRENGLQKTAKRKRYSRSCT